eukprot:TRINITY_DN6997_c0_g2_i1.p1 TRINITY_DN6997_c0_g2~~TRINITY_DN6997_c0_g2_i1.p1  ORF type:complete len:396 (+),score=97.28 TRINITY_DN6997_c0_g2_i1:97-1284(+)
MAAAKNVAAHQTGDAKLGGISMKWVSLVSLTVQTSAQVYVIKWARSGARGTPYLSTTIVLFTELVKLMVSFVLVAREAGGLGPAFMVLRKLFAGSAVETLKICVPSLLYTLQNNLMFVSLSRLPAAVQQVTYQLKIFTTALLSVLILGKTLTVQKWLSLVLLVVGVLMVQCTKEGLALDQVATGGDLSDAMVGFCAVLAACFTSGFASVYLEMLLKNTRASIWERNVQLGAFGGAMALGAVIIQDGNKVLHGGLTQGYDLRVVCVILNNALGGLLCAAVLKYADNILRCFSTALSIILTVLLSWLALQEYVPDALFVVGTILAIMATFFYTLGPAAASPGPAHRPASTMGVEDAASGGKNGHSHAHSNGAAADGKKVRAVRTASPGLTTTLRRHG